MRVVLLAMLLGCALAASVHEKVKRGADNMSKGNRTWRKKGELRKTVAKAEDQDQEPEGGDQEGSLMRVRRDTIKDCSPTLWPGNDFCYFFADHFEDAQYATLKSNIETVFNHYTSLSCVTFTEVESATSACPDGDVTPAKIMADNTGCWAHVGCGFSSPTSVSLPAKCEQLGVIYHEVFHALGRQHEQTREDRDDYVTVVTANIKSDKLHNYDICSRKLYNLRYDYQSIMHYGAYSFRCVDCGDTMLATQLSQQDKMGKQQKLSLIDIVTLNKMYSCYADPDVDAIEICNNRGALMSNGICHCEKPFMGNNCETVDLPTDQQFIITGSAEELELKSPDYPNSYPLNVDYNYFFECATAGKKVKLHFDTFKVEDWGCGYDKVKFRDPLDIYSDVECGIALDGKEFTGKGGNLIVEFISDNEYAYAGFLGKFTCV